MKVVLASNNAGKKIELEEALKPLHIELVPQSAFGIVEIEETGLTFIENALIKARHAAHLTGLPVIADDSGLVVPALHGEPGIYSARYAGANATSKENIEKLLSKLQPFSDGQRLAYFHCTLVLMAFDQDPIPLIADANWLGTIMHHAQGEGGFGYDPIFYDARTQKTAAELSLEQKNKISHRGTALQLLIKKWAEKSNMIIVE